MIVSAICDKCGDTVFADYIKVDGGGECPRWKVAVYCTSCGTYERRPRQQDGLADSDSVRQALRALVSEETDDV